MGVERANRQMNTLGGVIGGYAPLDSGLLVPASYLGSGTPDAHTFLRGDRAWVVPDLLAEVTGSNVASLDVTVRNVSGQSGLIFQSDYKVYVFEGFGIQPVSSGQAFVMQVGTGAGPTYDTSSIYYASVSAYNNSGIMSQARGDPGGAFYIASTLSNSSAFACSFTGRLRLPQSATLEKFFSGTSIYHDGSAICPGVFGGLYHTATALTAVRFLMAGGNITGTIRAYGMPET